MTKEIEWHNAPIKIEYGEGMLMADIGLDKDSTLSLACHRDDVDKVPRVLAQFGTGKAIHDDLKALANELTQRVNDFQELHGVAVDLVEWTTYEALGTAAKRQHFVKLRATLES